MNTFFFVVETHLFLASRGAQLEVMHRTVTQQDTGSGYQHVKVEVDIIVYYLDIKVRPLSDPIARGRENQGTSSQRRFFKTTI